MSGKFIVTGGAGFIGSNLIAALNERGERDILVVDELGRDERWRNLADLDYTDYWEKDDFRFAVRQDALGEVDTVFHLGACSSTTETNASYLADNNYRYTRELCEWCLDHGVRFIYASSAATYGDGAQGYEDDEEAIPRLRPLNMYGYSKQMFDKWALGHGIFDRVVGLKYFNVFGPREAHKGDMRSMVLKAFEQIRDTGEVKLFCSYRDAYADGEQRRDFLYVFDAVRATLFFHDNPRESGIYNVGTGVSRTWNDLARAVFAALGVETRIEYIPMPEALRDSYQYDTCAVVTKLREAGYQDPFATLEEASLDYVRNDLAK